LQIPPVLIFKAFIASAKGESFLKLILGARAEFSLSKALEADWEFMQSQSVLNQKANYQYPETLTGHQRVGDQRIKSQPAKCLA